jgi:hypothetical protein
MLSLTSCPECGVPAEITDQFWLPSTDGPVAHVAVSCAASHHFRMPAEGLPGQPRNPVRAAAVRCEPSP